MFPKIGSQPDFLTLFGIFDVLGEKHPILQKIEKIEIWDPQNSDFDIITLPSCKTILL
jgi:hypothetical protein